jgi:ParB family chromosome partitioning protein
MSPRKRRDKPYGGQITTPPTPWLEEPTATESPAQEPPVKVKLESIHLPKEQPRKYFDPQAQQKIIASVQQHGILQPLLVRPLSTGSYELVAGERRYRAAQEVGLAEVPIVVRDLSDEEAFQLALIENLQREDLNPIEETEGILHLLAIRLGQDIESLPTLLRQLFNAVSRGELETHNNDIIKGNASQAQADNNVIIEDDSPNSEADNNVIIKNSSDSSPPTNPETKAKNETDNNVIIKDNASQSQVNNNVIMTKELQAKLAQVEAVFQQLGLMSWQSFVTNRLPLLNLPDEIMSALRQGQIAYTKAKVLGKVKDENLRKELLKNAISANWSLSQIKEQALAHSQTAQAQTQSKTQQLSERLKSVYQQVKKSKIAENPKKQKKLEDLLNKLETLLGNE